MMDYSEHCVEARAALKELEKCAANGQRRAAEIASLRLLWAAIKLHVCFGKS
jgi:hypothetical protein